MLFIVLTPSLYILFTHTFTCFYFIYISYMSHITKIVTLCHLMGNFRKYPYTTKISIHDGRLQYFNPPLPSEIPKCVTPPCPQNSIIVNPPSPSEFPFFPQTLRNYQMCSQNAQLGLFYVNRFHITPLLWEKIGKKKDFCLPLCNSYNLLKFYIIPNCYRTLK